MNRATRGLPSADSAEALVEGKDGAIPTVVFHFLGRAVLIGGGLSLVGDRKNLVRSSLAASATIEFFVVGWMLLEHYRSKNS